MTSLWKTLSYLQSIARLWKQCDEYFLTAVLDIPDLLLLCASGFQELILLSYFWLIIRYFRQGETCNCTWNFLYHFFSLIVHRELFFRVDLTLYRECFWCIYLYKVNTVNPVSSKYDYPEVLFMLIFNWVDFVDAILMSHIFTEK